MHLIIGKNMEMCRLLTHIQSLVSDKLTRPCTCETDAARLNEIMNKGNNVCYKHVVFRWNVQGFPIGSEIRHRSIPYSKLPLDIGVLN